MRDLFFIILSVCALNVLNAQEFCGSIMPDEHAQFLKDNQQMLQTPVEVDSPTLHVPIVYHLVAEDNGNGRLRLSDLLTLHCELNEKYERSAIQFYIHEIDLINSSYWFNDNSYNVGNNLMLLNNVPGYCNVYVTNSAAGNCGYAFFPNSGPNGGGMVLNKDCSKPANTTYAHEMGHYMGLPHTFANIGGIEFVDGSNCASVGDLFCDTPADFLDFRWSCPYTGPQLDPQGDPYAGTLDETLYMSYSLDNCANRFSPMQELSMYNTLKTQRPNLLVHPTPSFDSLAISSLVAPANGTISVPVAPIELVWNKIDEADHYHLALSHQSSFGTLIVDTIVQDTSYTFRKSIKNLNYYWKVKPFNYDYACGDYSTVFTFKTKSFEIEPTIENVNCRGESTGSIFADIDGVPGSYTYSWSNGVQSAYNPNLAAGTYTVTISNGQDTDSATYNITQPSDHLEVFLNDLNGSNYDVLVLGGDPPYSYLWSNGATTSSTTITDSSGVTVEVTDANGCTITKTSGVVNGLTIDVADIDFIVFPNPLEGNDLFVKTNGKIDSPIKFKLISLQGAVVLESVFHKNAASWKVSLPDHLAARTYFAIFEYNGNVNQRKLFVDN